jgi:hypothetical protein
MKIKIVESTISADELKEIGKEFYISMIKGVVDIEKEIVAFGGEYHMDANIILLDSGSKQQDIWGFNIRFDEPKEHWIQYESLINIRPAQNNPSTEVHDQKIRDIMKRIINKKIE